ncbi:probable transmembrane ascorbate ferrireductase 3 [Panicum virgatum]|uniref:probable transmembrane ascorbate ferrireductase 3 n=1 Tax=Panicum virgatum TaxID=38727 RepID=UPI0019D62AAF|nr:probable transmembrane ascorbate ferrireductase 3 [Panicum virgatum]
MQPPVKLAPQEPTAPPLLPAGRLLAPPLASRDSTVFSSLPAGGERASERGCGRRRRVAMAHGIIGSHHHPIMASRVSMLAHVLFLTTAVLMLVWLLHYRGGINIQSEDPEQVFNVHPFVMSWGFILLIGEAILAYSSIPMVDHRTQKMAHMMIHLVGLILGIFGVYAAFKFHDAAVVPDLMSLHSWLGITAIALFGLQWLFGFVTFWLPAAHEHTRDAAAPAHVMAGLAIFMLAVCAAQTGLVQKSAGAASASEMKLINVTGIFILLYGVAVASAVALRRAFL